MLHQGPSVHVMLLLLTHGMMETPFLFGKKKKKKKVLYEINN